MLNWILALLLHQILDSLYPSGQQPDWPGKLGDSHPLCQCLAAGQAPGEGGYGASAAEPGPWPAAKDRHGREDEEDGWAAADRSQRPQKPQGYWESGEDDIDGKTLAELRVLEGLWCSVCWMLKVLCVQLFQIMFVATTSCALLNFSELVTALKSRCFISVCGWVKWPKCISPQMHREGPRGAARSPSISLGFQMFPGNGLSTCIILFLLLVTAWGENPKHSVLCCSLHTADYRGAEKDL